VKIYFERELKKMNIEPILNFGRKVIPKPIFEFFQPAYHYFLAFFGAFLYGFPSHKITVIGVIGTKGKTTTCDLIAQILNSSGHKTALVSTVLIRIGEKEWKNEKKQTMLGRFQLQKFLSQAVKDGCEYAIIETSSEGILQYRHRFIDYDVAVFTNLSPEHIERHNGFENYRDAKVKLFEKTAAKENGFGIYNLDDSNVEYFLKPFVKTRIGYTIENLKFKNQNLKLNLDKIIEIKNVRLGLNGTAFIVNNEKFEIILIGEFNVYNAAAAIATSLALNVPIEKIKSALAKAKPTPGRMEIVANNKNITVIIDYAHEPLSLESIYKVALRFTLYASRSKLICLLGAQGGGRDKWKRFEMGKIAGRYCGKIVLTNEDPYDEPPMDIISQIEIGVAATKKSDINWGEYVYKIVDRKKAIKKAISLAKKGDVVVLTGKGGEISMCVENNKKTSWDEKAVTEETLRNLS